MPFQTQNNRMRLILVALAMVAILLAVFSCNVTSENGHTYLNIQNDTTWSKFDTLEISWKDSLSGTSGILFYGTPSDLKDNNKFEADGYKGQKIQIIFKGFNKKVLVYEEHRGFDGAAPTEVTKEVISVPPVGPSPVVTQGKVRPPRVSIIKFDTLIAIHDTANFAADASLDSGSLKGFAWDFNGDGKTDDTSGIMGATANLKIAHQFDIPGSYNVSLKVYSTSDSMSTVTFTLVVLKDEPLADAGKDQTVYPDDLVKLQGIGKDGFGKVTRMEWKIGTQAYVETPGAIEFKASATLGDVVGLFRVTDDDSQSVVDTVVIHVVSRSISNLTDIGISAGKLSPQFDPAIFSYTDSVAYDLETITVSPIGNGAITVNDAPLVSGQTSSALKLKVGANPIIVTVKLAGTTSKTYQVNVVRPPPSSDANLSAIVLSAGPLDSSFTSNDTLYNISAPNSAATTTVKATLGNLSSSLSINGFKVNSGVVSGVIPLNVGSNTITVEVTAQGGDKKTYTLIVTRAGSAIADLSGLTLSAGNINPAFVTEITNYTLSVGTDVLTTNVTATVSNSASTLTINNQPAISGTAQSVNLVVGANTIYVVVTAQNGSKNLYSIQVTRAGNGNADLSALVLSAGDIVSPFTPEAVFYSLAVANNVTVTNVTATVSKETSTLTINGQPITTSKPVSINLVVGPNPVTIGVTAQTGDKKSYTVVVTRAPNANSDLKALSVSAGALSPSFAPGIFAYTLSVGNEITSTTVTPTDSMATSTVTVGNVDVPSGTASKPMALIVGDNTIDVIVTAQSGATKKYSIKITRAQVGNADLKSLSVSSGGSNWPFSPAFDKNMTLYVDSVPNSVENISVVGATVDSNATVAYSPSSFVNLVPGLNTVSVEVTAQNKSKKAYIIKIFRARNGNADLSTLVLSGGIIPLNFVKTITTYSVSVGNTDSVMRVTPTALAPTSKVTVNGIPVAYGATSGNLALAAGFNSIPIVVTAEDGTIKTYTINVTRALNSEATLLRLKVGVGNLLPVFNSGIMEYTDTLELDVKAIAITAIASNSKVQSIKIGATITALDSATVVVSTDFGDSRFLITVKAQDGSEKTYTLLIHRKVGWEKTFGGDGKDIGICVRQTADGGFIIAGSTTSSGSGGSDVYLLRTDPQGVALPGWPKTYGGAGEDVANSIQQTTDGGFIIVGYSSQLRSIYSMTYLLRIDGQGVPLSGWPKTFGGTSRKEAGNSVAQTSDGGFIITGFTDSLASFKLDAYLLRTDGQGVPLPGWPKIFGGNGEDIGKSVQQTSDGGFIITGSSSPTGTTNIDVYLLRTDGQGAPLPGWPKTFGGPDGPDVGNSVQQISDGGFIITGTFAGPEGGDIYLLRTDGQGAPLPGWPKTFGGVLNDDGNSVQQTTEGGFILTGTSLLSGGKSYDAYLLRTDGQGVPLPNWPKTFGGALGENGNSVQQTFDGGFIVTGSTASSGGADANVYLLRLNSQGNTK